MLDNLLAQANALVFTSSLTFFPHKYMVWFHAIHATTEHIIRCLIKYNIYIIFIYYLLYLYLLYDVNISL